LQERDGEKNFISILQHFPFTFVITVLYTDTDHNNAFLHRYQHHGYKRYTNAIIYAATREFHHSPCFCIASLLSLVFPINKNNKERVHKERRKEKFKLDHMTTLA
jgi:hypothetical protein